LQPTKKEKKKKKNSRIVFSGEPSSGHREYLSINSTLIGGRMIGWAV